MMTDYNSNETVGCVSRRRQAGPCDRLRRAVMLAHEGERRHTHHAGEHVCRVAHTHCMCTVGIRVIQDSPHNRACGQIAMKIMWCWRSRRDAPMLDEDEFASLQWPPDRTLTGSGRRAGTP